MMLDTTRNIDVANHLLFNNPSQDRGKIRYRTDYADGLKAFADRQYGDAAEYFCAADRTVRRLPEWNWVR